jgi:hypothetical protein
MQSTSFQNIEIAAASCFLGYEAEVFDAELHTVHERLLYPRSF